MNKYSLLFLNFISKFSSLFYRSKISRDTLYECVNTVLQTSQDKKRKFLETVELQIGLKNYDPQKDKRFSGTVKYVFTWLWDPVFGDLERKKKRFFFLKMIYWTFAIKLNTRKDCLMPFRELSFSRRTFYPGVLKKCGEVIITVISGSSWSCDGKLGIAKEKIRKIILKYFSFRKNIQ